MNPAIRTLRRLAALLAAGLLVCACSRLTAENYARLKVGMTYQEVTAILGSPAGCSDTAGFRTCKWGDDRSSITIRFAADKAVLYSSENIR
jgi:hypothetical protein